MPTQKKAAFILRLLFNTQMQINDSKFVIYLIIVIVDVYRQTCCN